MPSSERVYAALDELLAAIGQSNITLGYGGKSDAAYHGRHVVVQWSVEPMSITKPEEVAGMMCSSCWKPVESCSCGTPNPSFGDPK